MYLTEKVMIYINLLICILYKKPQYQQVGIVFVSLVGNLKNVLLPISFRVGFKVNLLIIELKLDMIYKNIVNIIIFLAY